MKKCHPAEMRKNIEIANQFGISGVDFVCIPVLNSIDKDNLLSLMINRLEEIAIKTEEENKQPL